MGWGNEATKGLGNDGREEGEEMTGGMAQGWPMMGPKGLENDKMEGWHMT